MDIDAHVGKKIMSLRKAAGLSIDKLAAATVIPTSLLEEYETGKQRVAPGHLLDIAKVLNVPLSTLFPASKELP